MTSRVNQHKRIYMLLPCIVYCASCAPLQKLCVRCSLSCEDAASELKKHQSVRVYAERLSEPVHDEIHNVSGLFKGDGRCAVVVPDCSKWGTQVMLWIYSDDKELVPETLYMRTDLKPVSTSCDPEAISDRSKPAGADGNVPNTLLILLAALLLHLLPP